eukprot:1018625-Pyramimonas_sp.AAC.1
MFRLQGESSAAVGSVACYYATTKPSACSCRAVGSIFLAARGERRGAAGSVAPPRTDGREAVFACSCRAVGSIFLAARGEERAPDSSETPSKWLQSDVILLCNM